jgi:hypothetical protein
MGWFVYGGPVGMSIAFIALPLLLLVFPRLLLSEDWDLYGGGSVTLSDRVALDDIPSGSEEESEFRAGKIVNPSRALFAGIRVLGAGM